MARKRRDENLREEIIGAAERLLAEGPGNLTARAVTAAAGVSTGTLFHYFPSIDHLVLAVAERAAGTQVGVFGDPERDGVEGVIGRLFDVDRRDTVLPWLRQRAIDAPQLRDGLRRYDDLVAARYLQAVTASAARLNLTDAADTEAAIEVVRALAEGLQLRLASDTLAVEPQRFVKVVAEMVAGWIAAEGQR